MDWMIFATIIGTGLTTIGSLIGINFYFFSGINARLDRQSSRTDRLYEMIIDLLKSRK